MKRSFINAQKIQESKFTTIIHTSLLMAYVALWLSFIILTMFFYFSPATPTPTLKKVELNIYYGSLDENNSDFISNDLLQMFDDDLQPIVNLRMVSWGKANVNQSGGIICKENQMFKNVFVYILKIMYQTIIKVILKKGISNRPHFSNCYRKSSWPRINIVVIICLKLQTKRIDHSLIAQPQ